MSDLVEIDPTRCRATSRQGRQCKQPPIPGGTVCRFHGGGAPQVRRAAEERLAVQQIEQLLDSMGGSLDVDPGEAILELVREAAFNVGWLRQQVSALRDGVTEMEFGPGGARRVTEKAIVRMYDAERERLAKFSQMAVAAGVEERRLRVEEDQAHVLVQVIAATLDDPELGLTHAQREMGRRIVGRNLRFATQPLTVASTSVD
jgi:hypothetical protein